MSSSSKFGEERDNQECHRRFALSYGCGTCLQLMGNCSEEQYVSAELTIEARTAVTIAVATISWDSA